MVGFFITEENASAAPGPAADTLSRGVSVRTNLVYLGLASPNLGIEIPVGEHFTVGAHAALKPWPRFLPTDTDVENTRKWRYLLLATDVRYWTESIYDGWFFGSNLDYSHFNVGNVDFPFGLYRRFHDYRLQGDYLGLGLFGGHSWWLSRRLRLEAEAGISAGYMKAGRYECAHCGARIDTDRGPLIVPKLGIHLGWNLTPRTTEKEQRHREWQEALH